jgi:hypothetical protein
VEDAITTAVSALVAIATALGALRGYDIWIKRRSNGSNGADSKSDSGPDNSALLQAFGRQQELTTEMIDLLRQTNQGLDRIEAGLERVLYHVVQVEKGVVQVEKGIEVLRDRRNHRP